MIFSYKGKNVLKKSDLAYKQEGEGTSHVYRPLGWKTNMEDSNEPVDFLNGLDSSNSEHIAHASVGCFQVNQHTQGWCSSRTTLHEWRSMVPWMTNGLN